MPEYVKQSLDRFVGQCGFKHKSEQLARQDQLRRLGVPRQQRSDHLGRTGTPGSRFLRAKLEHDPQTRMPPMRSSYFDREPRCIRDLYTALLYSAIYSCIEPRDSLTAMCPPSASEYYPANITIPSRSSALKADPQNVGKLCFPFILTGSA